MFPFIFKLSGKNLLFIGGGNVAKRKIESIIAWSNPEITIISKELHPSLQQLLEKHHIKWIQSSFDEKLISENYDFAFICTNDKSANEQAATILKRLNILVNICDNKELSDFYMPAVISYNDIMISISTKGDSPALSKKIKEILSEKLKGDE
ncbi:bifunctional precorrin-2 dehydrogenase/sirohydrochlorin ferrochelatase [Deferribacteraceae bacterium V6Fe1]|nr:bifunctional precorrin-2 dehydrogenase/sirohydrochlorin ferrochelatase [Deferribacteraceae bacterium V6Fe1]